MKDNKPVFIEKELETPKTFDVKNDEILPEIKGEILKISIGQVISLTLVNKAGFNHLRYCPHLLPIDNLHVTIELVDILS